MSNSKDDSNEIGFVLKSMLDRDPRKRRVKPNQKNYALLNLQMIGESSSDDEDYVPNSGVSLSSRKTSAAQDSDDHDTAGHTSSSDADSSDDNDDDADEEADEEDSEEEDDDDVDEKADKNEKTDSFRIETDRNGSESGIGSSDTRPPSIKCTFKRERNSSESFSIVRSEVKCDPNVKPKFTTTMSPSNTSKKQSQYDQWKRIMICSVCLGDQSNENDEIVECDCCSITVHEACYGLINAEDSELVSLDSNASSASTEPWFCDSCRGGEREQPLTCELCPELGGIFKQTETGRWVHLVCALYINDVAFSNTMTLSGITLFEMNYERWGARTCSLCDDERFARTGVCIACDAGMCRTYFHVSCAQKHGLLCEPQVHDDSGEVVDPFFAHCKQHATEKHVVKSKRRNFLALQSRMKAVRARKAPMNDRIRSKLDELRSQYDEETKMVAASSQHTLPLRAARPLISSCSVMRNMITKAELMGLSSRGQVILADDLIDVRKKWHIPAAFSVEFVSYYLDREPRFNELNERLRTLKLENEQLCEQESQLRQKYEQSHDRLVQLKQDHVQIAKSGQKLLGCVASIGGKSIDSAAFFMLESSSTNTVNGASLSNGSAQLNGNSVDRFSNSSTSTPTGSGGCSTNSILLLKRCGICQKCTDQHTMALCDHCSLHYHFTCLDPPLTRMPRKTKFGGWQCSECTSKEEESPDEDEETAADDSQSASRRRLRENVRCPSKYIPDTDFNLAAMGWFFFRLFTVYLIL